MSTRAIVIGASAGGVQALSEVLPTLPAGYPIPVLVVIHVPPRKANALVDLFARKCALQVKEAEDKEPLVSGTIYFAPPDYHLLVETDGALALSSDETVNYSRPAIDVLFESAAEVFGSGLTAIVLTGANHDGAAGLSAVCAKGGTCIVQNPVIAEASAMPSAALRACPTARIMTLAEMADCLKDMAK